MIKPQRATFSAFNFPVIGISPVNSAKLSIQLVSDALPTKFVGMAPNQGERDKSNIVREVTVLTGFHERSRTNANPAMAEGVEFEPEVRSALSVRPSHDFQAANYLSDKLKVVDRNFLRCMMMIVWNDLDARRPCRPQQL